MLLFVQFWSTGPPPSAKTSARHTDGARGGEASGQFLVGGDPPRRKTSARHTDGRWVVGHPVNFWSTGPLRWKTTVCHTPIYTGVGVRGKAVNGIGVNFGLRDPLGEKLPCVTRTGAGWWGIRSIFGQRDPHDENPPCATHPHTRAWGCVVRQ